MKVFIESRFPFKMSFLHRRCKAAPAGGLKAKPKRGEGEQASQSGFIYKVYRFIVKLLSRRSLSATLPP